jgi:hypothetical protein
MQFPQTIFPLIVTYQIRIANNGAVLFYDGTPGPTTLVGALSPSGGVDAFGTTYPAGSVWGTPGLTQYVQEGRGESGFEVDFWSAFTNEAVGSRIYESAHTNSGGTTEFGTLNVVSPTDSVQKDNVTIALLSSSADGTTQNAEIAMGWGDVTAFLGGTYFQLSFNGVQISAGNIVAVHPGTGTSRANPALAETWQAPTGLNSGWTTVGANTPARFRLEPYGDGKGVVRLDGELLTTGAGPWAAGTDLFNLGTGYSPATGHMFVNKSSIAVAAGNATVNVTSSGNVVNGQTFTAAGQSLYLDGMTFPLN